MAKELVILEEDKAWAKARIAELDEAIQALGPEFHEVFAQSSETWHDNAPFDALRDRQAVLDAERQYLKHILRQAPPGQPDILVGRVSIGTLVYLANGNAYKIAGDWTPFPGQINSGVMTISCEAPLAKALLAKRVGDAVKAGKQQTTVSRLD
jgi:transcription elongation GreA/GreB family factor